MTDAQPNVSERKMATVHSSNSHYCRSYRGKCVNNRILAIHRFPIDKTLKSAWLKRIRIVSPKFVFSEKNDRLCSPHFKDGKYIRKSSEHNLSSLFILQDVRLKQFESKIYEQEQQVDIQPEVEEPTPEEEEFLKTPFASRCNSESVSFMLDDYEGLIDDSSISSHFNKQTQTETIGINCITQTEMTIKVHKRTISRTIFTQTDRLVTNEVGVQVLRSNLTIEYIKTKEMCMLFTGLPNVDPFNLLFNELNDDEMRTRRRGNGENQGRPRSLRLVVEFFLVLMRLRLGLLLEDLDRRFHVSKSTACIITSRWISYLSIKLSRLTHWSMKSTVLLTMPRKFRNKYPNCRVIIDCTELYTETPQSLSNKSLMYSHYKSHMTWKALLGISSSGMITFVSDLLSGSVSDKQLVIKSGLLDLCQSGDGIMADKGYLISDLRSRREHSSYNSIIKI